MSRNLGTTVSVNTSAPVTNGSHTPNARKTNHPQTCRTQKQDPQLKNTSDPSISSHQGGKFVPPQTRTPVNHNGLHRSRSTASVLDKDLRTKYGGKEKESESATRLTLSTTKIINNNNNNDDKTPVTHYCTPRRNGEQSVLRQGSSSGGWNRKQANNQTKPALKRFFSEANLPKLSATPDCFNNVHIETPQSRAGSAEDLSELDVEASNLTVGIRVRPLNYREQSDSSVTNIINVEGNEVNVACDTGTTHSFTYDHCFWSCDPQHPQFASQDVVFNTMVQPLVDKAFEGYNACLFAYGQTGSGKSYSMMGLDVDSGGTYGKEAGIIPRFCYEVFDRIASLNDTTVSISSDSRITVEISYFEIYNEKIHDLLGGYCESGRRAALKVREHPVFGPYVVDLSAHGVVSYEDLQGWLKVGNSQRATAATGMNEKSSRSHSIFSVVLTQTQDEMVMDERHEHSRRSKINLVDLAGSERLSHTCASGDRLREGVSINRSLLTLGKVIASLAENTNNKRRGFVPYRDSVLTWLLRESLGGNSRTTMLATISPASVHADETLATLRYACQARTIINRVRVNEDPRDRLIRELSAEVQNLLTLRAEQERQTKKGAPRRLLDTTLSVHSAEREVQRLREQLSASQENLVTSQKCWSKRLKDAEKCKSEELQFLKRCGVAVQLDLEQQQQPYLVNLNPDPILSGTLLYLLPPGSVRVGRQGDIALNGPMVQANHCTIKNENGNLSLVPENGGQTYVNGNAVTSTVVLHHGDRVVFGNSHYFGLNNPLDHSANVPSKQPVDYLFAYQEIQKLQEDKLRAELEEAKQRALHELEEVQQQLGSQQSSYEQQLKQLANLLEQHKEALSEASLRKDELEAQKCSLEAEVKRHKSWAHLQPEESLTISPPHSNFLQEIEDVLNATCTDLEQSLRTSCEREPSLHEMHVAVQEATQRCKDLGIGYEFSQQHVVKEGGLEAKVKVRNLNKGLVASWHPSHFLSWLDQLRHFDLDDSLKELLDVEDEETWEEDEDDEERKFIPNGSHMSVDTKYIKRQLNESIHQLSMETSSCNDSQLALLHSNMLDITNNSNQDSILSEDMNIYVQQIERAVTHLERICCVDEARDTLDALARNVAQLKTDLKLRNIPSEESQNIQASNTFLFKHLFIRAPPSKSNLRSPCPNGLNTPKTSKMVRFTLTDSQEERHPE